MHDVSWVSDSKYKYYLHQVTSSFRNTTITALHTVLCNIEALQTALTPFHIRALIVCLDKERKLSTNCESLLV